VETDVPAPAFEASARGPPPRAINEGGSISDAYAALLERKLERWPAS
jgi:hypothetical protein